MKFELHPILSEMKAFYAQPISQDRFKEYLFKLQGNTKDDMVLPLMGYNPMAKPHVSSKVEELQNAGAENIVEEVIKRVNPFVQNDGNETIKIVLNLADDLKGSWTNRYTVDYDSKFKIGPVVERNFCTPYFWSSETYTQALIEKRVEESILRTWFWKIHKNPNTLESFLDQEIFVQRHSSIQKKKNSAMQVTEMDSFYNAHRTSEEYSLIFNFFYGDEASLSLGYPTFGIPEMTGFDYANILSLR